MASTIDQQDPAVVDEIESLQSIYNDDVVVSTTGAMMCIDIVIRPTLDTDDISLLEQFTVAIEVMIPSDYPSKAPPILNFVNCSSLELMEMHTLTSKCESLFNEDEVIIYEWVEKIRDHLTEKASHVQALEARLHDDVLNSPEVLYSVEELRTPLASPTGHQQECDNKDESDKMEESMLHGEPFTDRRSTFQAHVSQVHSQTEIERKLHLLKSKRKIATATHNILAYRFFDISKNVLIQDCDDDGESAAGGRLLHLLQIMDAVNVVVVVSRWYGGIQLGPDRFKHISNVARTLLLSSGLVESKQMSVKKKGGQKKKQ